MFVSKRFLENVVPIDDNLRDSFKDIISEILDEFFADKPLFNSDNTYLYYYDEYRLKTCVTPKSKNVLYLEIDQPQNIKKWIKKEKRHTYPELYYPLKKLKADLMDFCIKRFDSDTLLWVDKFGLNFSINLYNDEGDMRNVNFEIIPCITYKNENDKTGVMYFNEDSKDFIIEYPDLATANFIAKNKATLGLYKDYVIIFKNIIRELKNEKVIPSEIYETILYNVPNIFYENFSLENFERILNYIRNSSLYKYKSLDEQDFAFVTLYRPMNIVYVKHIIKLFENFIKKLK